MTTINDVKIAIPKLEWKISNDRMTVTFIASGKRKSDTEVSALLENADVNLSINKLREMILEDARQEVEDDSNKGEIVFLDLPLLESKLNEDSDLTEADDVIWADLKFVKDDTSIFYVRDADNSNTYTAYLTAASSSDKSDIKALKEAYYGHVSNRPEQIVKALLRNSRVDIQYFETIKDQLPVTAWKYLKIKARKKKEIVTMEKLVIPSGSPDKLYQGLIDFEADFRTGGKHDIEEPAQLTNDPNEAAIAYINLDELNKQYEGQHSTLWDDFLLQRLHKPEYVSIFKAWTYSIAVGKNNSRQEMWLYGNGGTGKSCLCKAFIRGFNNLAGKDICLAGSKDTGKSNFNSELLNKHLLVYPDAKNLKSGMSEFKHNATGGDFMRIEGKCKAATSAFVYLKCLTCSNELPKVDMTDRSQSSRYIVLPFTLDDNEMKQYGLMDKAGQLIGSATFQSELDNEFNCFLASCREHYEKRCKTNSNIDANEALDELSAIEMDEIAIIEEFIDSFLTITKDPTDRITQKEFRQQCLYGIDYMDEDTGVRAYNDIKVEAIRTYLEKKYNFKWKYARVGSLATKAVVSDRFGIKVKTGNTTISNEKVFDD